MAKDYRLRLLKHLKEFYPNKTNISPLLHEYLNETNSPRPYYSDILHKLKKDGFVIFGNEATDCITTARAQVYNDSHIMVGLTHPGLDEIVRLEKQDYNLKNAERVYKTYPLTKKLAIAGFIISLVLALLKIAEVLKWLPLKL